MSQRYSNKKTMTLETIDISKLNTFHKNNKFTITGIENHHDEIVSHIVLMHGHLTNLLGPAVIQSTTGNRITPKVFCNAMREVLKHALALCDHMEYEFYEDEGFESFEQGLDPIIKNDTILTLTMMMISALDILHILYLDLDSKPIWAEEEVPGSIEENIFSIIVGIRALGKKQGFSFNDVLSGM